MIKKLRIKFICVNMLIVTCMLALLFTTLFVFMHKSLEQNQLAGMVRAAEEPLPKHALWKGGANELRLPAIVLEKMPDGSLISAGNGSYDLTEQEALEALWDAAWDEEEPVGILSDYGLRYYRSDGPRGQKLVFADLSAERVTLRSLAKTCALIGASRPEQITENVCALDAAPLSGAELERIGEILNS